MSGNHYVLFGGSEVILQARKRGLEIRDTFLILSPEGGRTAVLARSPLTENTVVEQVLSTETGAINIDRCRISTSDAIFNKSRSVDAVSRSIFKADRSNTTLQDQAAYMTEGQQFGRWPPNILFVHGPDCKREGTTKVKGHKGYPNGPGGKSYQYSSDKRGSEVRPNAWKGHADEEGNELIAQWNCQPNCPVLALDTQSGVLKSGSFSPVVRSNRSGFAGPTPALSTYVTAKSEGGASRFYPQFANEKGMLEWLTQLVAPHGVVLTGLTPQLNLSV